MVALITVVATYDSSLTYFSIGRTFSIPTNTQISGFRMLPTTPVIKGVVGQVPETNFLSLKTVKFGELYVNMTLDQYNALIAAAVVAPGSPTQEITYTIGPTPPQIPAGATITTAWLYNKTILAIFVDGVQEDIRNFTYTPGVGVATLDFSSIGGLSATSVVQIIGYTP